MIRTLTRAGIAPLAALAVLVTLLAAPAAVHAQRQVAVNIDSQPQGATVRLDSETAAPLGTTPLRRTRIPAGAHTLYFTRDGYVSSRIDISVGRRNETFTAQLQQAGSVYVSADVDGAQVFMDGNPVGTTPGRINNVPPGPHVIEIRQQGMQPHRESVTVGAGAMATINATLRPPPPQTPPTGTVRVIVSNPNGANPPDLQVTFDGTPMQGSPPAVTDAQPGDHIIQVSANGFRTVRRPATVTAGQSTVVAIDLEAIPQVPTGGVVRVLVPTQGAQVYLDGELLTGTPPQRENVPAGTHALRVTAPNHQPATREITVTAGQTNVQQFDDLPTVAQVGRISVRSTTPNAQVFVDGRQVGTVPFSRDDMPAGEHDVMVHANGFDDRTQHCTITPAQACEVNLPLSRTVGRAAIHVELGRPTRTPATVLIDGQPVGEVGAGRDIPNVPASTHEIRVQAPGYADYVESITLQENENHRMIVTLHRDRGGLSSADLAARRTAISTWGANPLARGDAAIDIIGGIFGFPVELRGTIGLMPYSIFGIDAGFGLRSMGFYNELEGRARLGLRLAGGLFSIGAEANLFGALSTAGSGGFGGRGFLILSMHTLALSSEEAADEDESGQRERSNTAGSFAFSLRFGFEAMRDGLNGLVYRGYNSMNPNNPPTFDACDVRQPVPGMTGTFQTAMMDRGRACGLSLNDRPRTGTMGGDTIVQDGAQTLVRMLLGFRLEVGVSRHVNLFGGLDIVPTGIGNGGVNANQQRRAIYQYLYSTFGQPGTDSLAYVYIGLTYKF